MASYWMDEGTPEWKRTVLAVGIYSAAFNVHHRPVWDWVFGNLATDFAVPPWIGQVGSGTSATVDADRE